MRSPGQPPTSPNRNLFSIRIIEARLSLNVAKFGRMHVVAEVRYGRQIYRTQVASGTDQAPVWNEMQLMEVTEEQLVHVNLVHTALLIGDVAIGSCDITLGLAAKRWRSSWWELKSSEGKIGSMHLSFGFDGSIRPFSSPDESYQICSSLQERVLTKMNELELEREELEYLKLRYKRKQEKLNQEKRRYRAKVQTVVEIKGNAVKEENGLRSLLSPRIGDESGRRQKSINLREELLAVEHRRVLEDRSALDQEKSEFSQLKQAVKSELSKLQAEKQVFESQQQEFQGHIELSLNKSPLKTSLSHDSLPSLDYNTQEQLNEIRQIRVTLAQKQELLDAHLKDVETKRMQMADARENAALRRKKTDKKTNRTFSEAAD